MYDTFNFCVGILLGALVGSLATLFYHLRQIRHEARQNYIRLSLAQGEVVTLERTLEIHRRSSMREFTQTTDGFTLPECEAITPLPRIPPWMGSRNAPTAGRDAFRTRNVSEAGEL